MAKDWGDSGFSVSSSGSLTGEFTGASASFEIFRLAISSWNSVLTCKCSERVHSLHTHTHAGHTSVLINTVTEVLQGPIFNTNNYNLMWCHRSVNTLLESFCGETAFKSSVLFSNLIVAPWPWGERCRVHHSVHSVAFNQILKITSISL